MGLAKTGNKQQLAERIYNHVHATAEIETRKLQILQDMQHSIRNGYGEHHSFYKSHFNGVDMFNKLFYAYDYGYKIYHWKVRMVMSVLKNLLISTFALVVEKEKERDPTVLEMDLLTFRKVVIRKYYKCRKESTVACIFE